MQRDMVKIRIIAPGKHLIPEGYVRQGKVLSVQREHANQYVNILKLAELVDPVGPAETPQAGPSQTKPARAAEKKSSAAVPGGPSTDSQKSNVGGTVRSSFASGTDRVSTSGSAGSSKPGGGMGRDGTS